MLDKVMAFTVASVGFVRERGRSLVRDAKGFSMQAIMITGGFVLIATIVVVTLVNQARQSSDSVGDAISDQVSDLNAALDDETIITT